jgi:hypothetical protein
MYTLRAQIEYQAVATAEIALWTAAKPVLVVDKAALEKAHA